MMISWNYWQYIAQKVSCWCENMHNLNLHETPECTGLRWETYFAERSLPQHLEQFKLRSVSLLWALLDHVGNVDLLDVSIFLKRWTQTIWENCQLQKTGSNSMCEEKKKRSASFTLHQKKGKHTEEWFKTVPGSDSGRLTMLICQF